MAFVEKTDAEFQEIFTNILDLSSKDNTYKFAFARFLLDYSNSNTEERVNFSTIANYFLKYYWNQECKYKLKQAPQIEKRPEIIKIIQKEFTKNYYPQSFADIQKDEPEKIQRCIKKITNACFHNVTWRFQKVKIGKTTRNENVFFDFRFRKISHKNKKFIDLDYGINLNPNAMIFFKKYNVGLKKDVSLEWARFLEKLNLGVPRLIAKTEGELVQRGNLSKYKKALQPFFKNCFYCNNQLKPGKETHVDHVIPFDYIAEDEMWNFALACQKCNCEKLGSLPPVSFLKKIISRNNDFRNKIALLDKSLTVLGLDFEKRINDHYENAKSHGYMVLDKFPI